MHACLIGLRAVLAKGTRRPRAPAVVCVCALRFSSPLVRRRRPLRPADAPNESKLLALPGKGAFEQSAEWRERERKLVWSLKNLRGGREHTLRCRLTGVGVCGWGAARSPSRRGLSAWPAVPPGGGEGACAQGSSVPMPTPCPPPRLLRLVDAGSVESTKRDYGPIMVQFVLPGKPSGAANTEAALAPAALGFCMLPLLCGLLAARPASPTLPWSTLYFQPCWVVGCPCGATVLQPAGWMCGT